MRLQTDKLHLHFLTELSMYWELYLLFLSSCGMFTVAAVAVNGLVSAYALRGFFPEHLWKKAFGVLGN